MTRPRHIIAALALAACCSWVAPVEAQVSAQDEPIVIGKRERPRGSFHLEPFDASLLLYGRYSDYHFDSADQRSAVTQSYARELLYLHTSGHAFSPGFFRFDARGAFGLSQSDITTKGIFLEPGESAESGNSGEDQTAYEFNLNADILSRTNHPIRVYADRNVELIDRSFAPSLESINELYGIDLTWQTKNVQNIFRVYRDKITQHSLGGEDEFASTQDTFEWQGNARLSPRQSLDWAYSYSITDSSSRQAGFDAENQTLESHAAQIGHSWAFGEGGKHSLRSSLYYNLLQEQTDSEQLRIEEQLTLRHSETLDSFYNYSYYQSEFSGNELAQHRGRAGLRHRLYRSLVTTASAGASTTDLEDGGIDEQFADLNFDYTKQVPLGQLLANLRASYSSQQNQARNSTLFVIDQPLSFTGVQPILINQRNVIPSSIRITDSHNVRVYREGTDYTVDAFPDRVEIRRVPGGDIPENTTVLTDYQLAPESANDTTTTTISFGAKYQFHEGPLRGLAPYFQYTISDQNISTHGGTPIPEDDVRELIVGVQYEIWKLYFQAEHQDHDSTLSPFVTDRFLARYTDRWGANLGVSAGVNYTATDYASRGNADSLALDLSASYQISRDFSASASVRWFDLKAFGEHTTGTEEELTLRWRRRQTSIYGSVRHTTLNTETQDTDFLLFQLTLERQF